MKKLITGLSTILSISASASIALSAAYTGPGEKTTIAENQKKYSEFCQGVANSDSPPKVNYLGEKVKRAAMKLSAVSNYSFYFYSGPLKAYGLKPAAEDRDSKPAKAPEAYADGSATQAPVGTSHNAHNFLSILCGEFRDRASMIEAKLDWIGNLYKLPVQEQKKIDLSKNLWSQVSAYSYNPYLEFSAKLWQARQIEKSSTFTLGGYDVESPIEGQLVCETKFIFDQYILKNKSFSSLTSFEQGYKKFESTDGNCSTSDKNSYYDFRGDSNFKPNTPESNGMIWYSSSISNQCKTTTTAKEKAKISGAVCSSYFKTPFKFRWDASRAGLSTWLFRHSKYDSVFSKEGETVYVVPSQGDVTQPFEFKINGAKHKEFLPAWSPAASWGLVDIGFNSLFKLGSDVEPNLKMAYERIRDAVNRHTDWYSSGFDDGMGMVREQAYSPFVASSYEMSASDEFTSPGLTVNSPSDGKKHWMFIFRVKKQNWYTTKSMAENKPIDFDRHWFDEMSFGTNEMAKLERAWDRLGTPLEDELDSILYLHNIPSYGGRPVADTYPNLNDF